MPADQIRNRTVGCKMTDGEYVLRFGTGRFLSEDPIESQGGINFYRYVRNNPTTWTDPFGLQEQQPPLPPGTYPFDPGPPPSPLPPSLPPGWDNKGGAGGTLGPPPSPKGGASCPVNERRESCEVQWENDNSVCRILSEASARARCYQSANQRL